MGDNWHGYRRHIGEAVVEYLAYCKANGLADGTIGTRRTAFNKMEEVLGRDRWVHGIEPQDMTRVWTRCGRDREQNTLRVDYQAFKGFFEWCEDMKYRARFESPFKHVRRPKTIKKERNRVPEEQFQELMGAAEAYDGLWARMFVAKGLYILGRKVEMNHIQIGDINRDEGIRLFRSKTGDGDRMPIADEFQAELDEYFKWYRWITETEKLDPSWYLVPRFTRPSFVPGSNREMHRGFIRPDVMLAQDAGTRITKIALEKIGFPLRDAETGKAKNEGAHTLRRSGARALYNNLVEMGHDGAMRTVQQMLGHVKMSQTEEYIGLTLDRKLRNDLIHGKVMYRKAQKAPAVVEPAVEVPAIVAEPETPVATGKTYGHLRVVS